MSTPLRVGVIGSGGVAQMMHLHYLHSLPDRFQIAALSDLSRGVLDRVGARYNVPANRRFARYQDLLAENLDAVLILTGGDHYPQILDALSVGKHVFVEKPMTYTVAEADECIAAAERANLKLMVGYMKRFDPGYQYARRLIQNLPDIRYIQINTLHPAESGYMEHHGIVRMDDISPGVLQPLIAADNARATRAVGQVSPLLREIYTNVLLGSMVHDINALRGLVGEPSAVTFSQLWPEGEQDICITTALEYPANCRVIFTWAFLRDLRDYFEEIAVMAPTGRIRIQFPSPFLRHFPTPVVVQGMENGAEYTKRVVVSYDEAFQQELLAFYDCIVTGAPSPSDGASARQDIVVLQKIFSQLHPQGLGGEAGQYA